MTAAHTTILIVEDEPITREIVARYLVHVGFRVRLAETGEEALTILREEGRVIDWLVTDVHLPGTISGWVVGAEFHLSYPLRPVIYASAFAPKTAADAAGGVYISKPYSPAMIADLVHRLSAQDSTDDFRTPAERLVELMAAQIEAA